MRLNAKQLCCLSHRRLQNVKPRRIPISQTWSHPFLQTLPTPPTTIHVSNKRFSSRKTDACFQKKLPEYFGYEHFFRYTSGRWLWDEQKQLQERYRAFNVPELQAVCAKAVGSDFCASMEKLAEGNSNKVFRLLMNDGKTALARIPNPNAGPAFYTAASEAQTVLGIPVPRVLEWNANADNPVGSEYIVMEEATGTQLAMVWDDMQPEQQVKIVNEIVAVETKMLSISFSHYGCIYFASDVVRDAVPAQITSDVSAELREQVRGKFTIGPIVDIQFWKEERAHMDISQGPWSNPKDYALSIARREIEWINRYATPKLSESPIWFDEAQETQTSREAHIDLLERYMKLAPYLVELPKPLTNSTSWHTDLRFPNIFVKDDRITSIIDWQGIWSGPFFFNVRVSPVIDYEGEMVLERPDNFDELDSERQNEIKNQISRSLLLQLYLIETGEKNPTLSAALGLEYGKLRRWPLLLAGNTWNDEIMPFRECLMKVEKAWKELGIEEPWPVHFSKEEKKKHLEEGEGWNEVQDFFDSLSSAVQRDGWTRHETFDDALSLFQDLREAVLTELKGEDRKQYEKRTRGLEKAK